jgi:hypothetical protein
MAASRSFYEGTLGLHGEAAPGGYALRAGAGTQLFLLDGPGYAGRAEWPLASFQTDDLAGTVAELHDAGVELEMMGDADPFQTDERGYRRPGGHADRLVSRSRQPGHLGVPAEIGIGGRSAAQYSSDCGRLSVISNHGAFDPTKMCSPGRIAGMSSSEPIATWT